MVPRQTRRALLRASATAATAGLAGCYFGPTDPRESNRTPTDDANAANGGGSAAVGSSDADGTPTGDATPTARAERTFSFELENSITTAQLEETDGLAADTPATVVVDVEAHYDDREETAFENTFELAPGASRTAAEAFTTERGPQYVVRTVLDGPYAEYSSRSANSSAGYRFTPGGFGGPTGTTFEVTVRNANPEENGGVIPVLTMSIPE